MPHAFIHLIGLSLFISISLLFCFLVKKVVNIIEMLKRGRQNETNFKFHLPSNPIPKSRHPTTTCRPSLATRKGLFRAARRRCRHINCRNRARIRRLVQEDGSGVGGLGVRGLGGYGGCLYILLVIFTWRTLKYVEISSWFFQGLGYYKDSGAAARRINNLPSCLDRDGSPVWTMANPIVWVVPNMISFHR